MAEKGKADAGRRRKPRGPAIDRKALKEVKEGIIERELLRLAYRLKRWCQQIVLVLTLF